MGENGPDPQWYRYKVAESLAVFAVLAEDESIVEELVTEHCKRRLDFLHIETNTLDNKCALITGEDKVFYDHLKALHLAIGECVVIETFKEDSKDAEELAKHAAKVKKQGDRTSLYQPKLPF